MPLDRFRILGRMYDAIVIGAGTAGLSAALALGRARHRVLVCDHGAPRNVRTPEAHNLFTRDGTPPLDLLKIGREQLQAYASVEIRELEVVDIVPQGDGFNVIDASGNTLETRKVILATGLVDELPSIEGLRERFGVTVLHCPYCHGWEVRDRELGILGNGEGGFELCKLAHGWSHRLTLLTDGPAEVDRAALYQMDIPLREKRIAHIEGEATVVFRDGEKQHFDALFLRPIRRQRSELPAKLGCAMSEAGIVEVDSTGQTSVPGVYAAGDMIEPMWQILPAASFTGARAGIGVSRTLLV